MKTFSMMMLGLVMLVVTGVLAGSGRRRMRRPST